MIDKNFCMSSFLAFRYIEAENIDFKEGLHHKNFIPVPDDEKIICNTAYDIDINIEKQFRQLREKSRHIGIMLSGGMDSAILASYMHGCDAYTFRFLGGAFQNDELKRAEYYAKYYGLTLHYVDISWETVEKYLNDVMIAKAAPVHSIEPQILQAALQAKADGIDMMIVGESSDLVFGGMHYLLSKDWTFDDFVNRYIFINPQEVLNESTDVRYLFERYRLPNNKIDFLKFMDDIFAIESSGSYFNAFGVAKLSYYDPYARLKMGMPLDLYRVRHGEPKYLIRELMTKKYPEIHVPEKVPMPRLVDFYFNDWVGPTRSEFRKDVDYSKFTGDQKWLIWCLEQFLNLINI